MLRSVIRKIAGITLVLLLLMLIGSAALYALVLAGTFGELPTKVELANIENEQASLFMANDGSLIGTVFAENRTDVRKDELPLHLKDALIATEDKRFFQHEGVDLWGYGRVLVRTVLFRDRSGGGGSTISQQIAKNLYGRKAHGGLSLPVAKIREAIIAQRIEEVLDKDEVITLYLNTVPFGENLFGIEAASRRFFGMKTSALDLAASATLIGMLKANTRYNPRLAPEASSQRRDVVLQLMQEQGMITSEAAEKVIGTPIDLRYQNIDKDGPAPYFLTEARKAAERILDRWNERTGQTLDLRKNGLRVHCTIDPQVQDAAVSAAKDQLLRMQPKLDRELARNKVRNTWEKHAIERKDPRWNAKSTAVRDLFLWGELPKQPITFRDSLWHYQKMLHAAVMVMQPRTGKVLAWVGGNDHRYLPFDMVRSHRQLASAYKPILYTAALQDGLEPCTYLNNEVRSYEGFPDWKPANFDQTSGGEVSMWNALARSMNLPTIDLYFRTSDERIQATCAALGLPEPPSNTPALALGALDVSLFEAVRAYATFANEGTRMEPMFIDSISDANGKRIYTAPRQKGEQVLDPDVALAINAMLQAAVDSGTCRAVRSRYGIRNAFAGKTGTSQNYSDAWNILYEPGIVCGVWVGARDPSIHFYTSEGSGSQLALPIAASVIQRMEKDLRLNKRYIRPFSIRQRGLELIACAPYRERSSVQEIIDDIFKGRKARSSKKEKKKGNFFERLFKKKK